MRRWRSRGLSLSASRNLAAILGIVVLGISAAAAEPLRLEVHACASEIRFILGGNVHTVHGGFQIASGSVLFDPADGSLSGRRVLPRVTLRDGR